MRWASVLGQIHLRYKVLLLLLFIIIIIINITTIIIIIIIIVIKVLAFEANKMLEHFRPW